jgi:RNA polymerase sigma-70 factor (ECF subfamily)
MTPQVRQLVAQQGPKALGFAYSLTGSKEDAQDMVQESLGRVVERWSSYDSARPLPPWFFKILKNTCLDDRKRTRHRRRLSLDMGINEGIDGAVATHLEALASDSRCPLDNLIRQEESAATRQVLSRLPPAHRKVLKLCGMEGFKYDEAAKALGVPVGTVRSRMHRAKRAFRLCLAKLDSQDEVRPGV